MTDRLPPNLLPLFQARPPLRYLPNNDHAPEERRTAHIDGVANLVGALRAKQAADEHLPITECDIERRKRVKAEKAARQRYLLNEGFKEQYKPNEDPNIRGDAFKTLFVSRLPFTASIRDLENAFNRFGSIERVRIALDENGKSRGYAFILFDKESEMKAAYKACEYLTIGGRQVLVDVERGRTTAGWRPRRFGGGLGGRGYTKMPAKPIGGYGPPSGPGGFVSRGGFRGGGYDRGGGFRGRGGFRGGGGYQGRGGHGGYPDGAPAGPRQGGGYNGGRFDDRGPRNANLEPLPSRGGYRDQDRGPKRRYDHDGPSYDDHPRPQQRRRY